ncbi:N-acetyllactosaminide beta-1,3-N-acetylglucosaminyltransferase 3-like isoform X2 [Esox lucius]|uniref:Hexosyltransferase n=1 Tax=Esox lucius TaxID=8010 RepID=A0A3P8Y8W9_ESOLU|nr:N-acetyllactosaminide beta-1,3-N-acetylglucosaminyltransferase 3-like isoform X2 [Esox lucius]
MGCITRLFLRWRVFKLIALALSIWAMLLLHRYLLNPTSPSDLHRAFLQSRHIRFYPIVTQPCCSCLQSANPTPRPNPGPSHKRLGSLSSRSRRGARGNPCQCSCPSPSCRPILLLLAIKSHPAHSARRAAIRATWGRERVLKGERVSRVFLLGLGGEEGDSGVRKESERYGDILQWMFQESFFNVTLKEVLFWNWFQQECSRTVLYVLKGDDDVYVDVERVVGLLQGRERAVMRRDSGEMREQTGRGEEASVGDRTGTESEHWGKILIRSGRAMESRAKMTRESGQGTERLNETETNKARTVASPQPLYMGHIFVDTHPVRIWWNKYYVPYSLYTGPYPPYAGGGGYLLCREALALLHQASTKLSLFPIDDVYVGLVAQAANISATHHPGFLPVEYSFYRHPCNYFNSFMVLHKLLPDDMLHLWSFLQTQGHSCREPRMD